MTKYEKDRVRSKVKLRKRWQRIDAKKSDAMCVRWDLKGIVHYKLLLPPGQID